jgi:OmpA-OmpF porin, OOP family
MKKILVSLLMITVSTQVFAQDQNKNNVRPAYVGVSFIMNDYLSAQRVRNSSLTSVLTNRRLAKFREMAPGIGITYFKGLRNHLDIAGTLTGSFPSVPKNDGTSTAGDQFMLEGDISAQLKLLSEKYDFTPYVNVGIGVSRLDGKTDAFLPLGFGLKYNIEDETSIFLTGQYRVPATFNANNYHFMYGIGFAGRVGKKMEPPVAKVVEVPQAPKDTDNDGITDDQDKCPTVAGVARYNGCPVPDTDNDGINDEEDKCPTVAGSAKYNGCPIPDSDLDGINDEEDKCPQVKGVAKYDGCPVPDSDNDGINDEEDRCPQLAGVRENNGCPEVKTEIIKKLEYAAQRIYFATGSAKLLNTSFKSLDDVVRILNEDPNLKLSIEGHTDNVGKDDYNHKLSHDRAASVKNYLVSKGIDESRLTSIGFGETQPIADNKTAAGRAKNRRVVMKVEY